MCGNKMKIFGLLSLLLILSVWAISFGIAWTGGIRGLELFGVCLFFTGGVVLILVQLIPAEILFSSFLGTTVGFFRRSQTDSHSTLPQSR